jgi:hypothetical protein
MKLQQGQTWKQGEQHLRIVHLERLEVEYKAITDLPTRKGTHHHVTKKDFCRLIKGATLLPDDKPEKKAPAKKPAKKPEKKPAA